MPEGAAPHPFPVRDYTLTSLATGLSALNVRELRERVEGAPTGSLLHHFWGRLLRFGESRGEYGNDLAEWAGTALHDPVLAERLALVDPVRAGDPESLRVRVLEVLDERLEELQGHPVEASPENPFHFVADQMVVYETDRTLADPEELFASLEELSPQSLFLHFVSPPGLEAVHDLAVVPWLRAFGGAGAGAADAVEAMDVFLLRSGELRERIREALDPYLGSDGGGAR